MRKKPSLLSKLFSRSWHDLPNRRAVPHPKKKRPRLLFEQLEDRFVPSTYNVGPGQPLATVGAVPWNNLQPGDVVNINWQPAAYHEKIILSNSGTPTQHIVINGIAGPLGQLPVLDGANATSSPNSPQFGYTPLQDLGLIVIYRDNTKPYTYQPSNIDINNLQLQGAADGNTFTGYNGDSRTYGGGAAGIWTEGSVNLTIHGCIITNNDNGVFAKSGGGPGTTYNITLDSNYLYGNGVANNYLYHDSYVEAYGALYQYNRYGPLRAGAPGNALKDRSSSTIIRYNYIQDGGHLLDLDEPQDGYADISTDPNYLRTIVYGNVLASDANGPTLLVHYGDGGGVSSYRNGGVLYFYDNTLTNQADRSGRWRTIVFQMETNQVSVDARNNIFFNTANTPGGTPSNFEFGMYDGNINFATSNWVSPGWFASESQELGQSYNGTISGTNNFYSPANNNPGFANLATYDAHLLDGSGAIGRGGSLASAVATDYPVARQYVYNQSSQPRPTVSDLGAFAYAGSTIGSVSSFALVPSVSSTTAGSALTVTVTAKDALGNTVTGYTGTVHFTSSDAQAVLPADYAFTAADAGVHTFSVTLKTAGTDTITATDTSTFLVTGSASVAVSAAAAVIVDTGSPGYSETGTGWYTTIRTGYSAHPRADAPGSGSDTATWQASGFAPGKITVQATWNPYSDRAPNAAFQIYDGATLLKTVVVNQTQNPTGNAMVNGWVFQDLGTLNFTSGTVKVVLSNNAGGYVVADGVRFVPLSIPVIVDTGNQGYSETGTGWYTTIRTGYSFHPRADAPGTGSDTATWQASGFAPGKITVQATWNPYSDRAPNAAFQIYDGATLLTTVVVNQTQNPSGNTTVNGWVFQDLATLQFTSGIVKVVLSNNANGYVVADALRMVPVPAAVTDLNWNGGWITGPTSTGTASTFTINRTYNITGAAAPRDFTIGYYASMDNVFGGSNDFLLGTETISAAADKAVGTHAGTSPALQFNVGGTYHLFARLDDGNALPEADKTNNVAEAPQQINVTVAMPVIVSSGDPGYSETGTAWYTTVRGGYSTHPRADAPGTGSETATWQASGFAAGSTVTVQATWNPYSDRAPNAAFQIYDGTTLLKTVVVNQTQNPTGSTTVNGWVFQDLATLSFASGTVKVVLSNNAGGYVVADTVRLVPLPGPVIVDTGSPGYSETGTGWYTTLRTGYSAHPRADAPGTGSDTATWQASGFAAGSYLTVQAAWNPYSDRAPNAAFQIYDGATLLTTVVVNQTQNPSGNTTVNGWVFQDLTTLRFNSGTVKVVLSNNASGYVVADALRFMPAPAPNSVIVDTGSSGYSETGTGWYTTIRSGYSAHPRADAPSNSSDNATWQASGFAAGSTVTVQATWNPYSDRASNAAFQIYDGATLLKTVVVNQMQNPIGSTTVNGWVFQDLATLNLTSGTIKVVVSNNASGYVIADAMRMVIV